ncbi:alpha/beta fold hydrolase [Noviherbaspirillum denitrificans]|uniref:Alpha/beta hydrolase n=1 Tax=Noviherbaspirillum denitrificans TaxID=1968433 RepID=A0A254TG19_9BURK|nr:alpha/beta fold hydrolase [Noviherbaspirillum denitrificans]OWW21606.1 alpha/beta hydrolase [Noviherbaspirillum denitrificans]
MRFSEDRLSRLACSDKVERAIHIWEPPRTRAVILAIHGGMAHAGDYVTPALWFRDKGFATVSYDMCGHDGKKRVDIPGFHSYLDDGERFLKWVKRHYPGLPVFVMGHSMGALIATRLGLERIPHDPAIMGFILSSPYYVNAIKVPAVLLKLSNVLARLFPTARVPLESLTHMLTHDQAITKRHYEDEKDNIRATEVSFRFAKSLQAAQEGLAGKMPSWRYPVFAVVAGDDKLADARASESMLKSIDASLLEYRFHPHNFHENFNELNREETFADILGWLEIQLATAQTRCQTG